MQPFLEEINLNNNNWVDAPIKEHYDEVPVGFLANYNFAGTLGTCIQLIQPFRNSADPETKLLNELSMDVNTRSMGSTYTGVVPSKVFHKYKIASSFLGWFKETHNAQIARVKYVKIPSKSSIAPHIDGGPFYEKHNRFHLVLQGEYQYTVNGEEREYKEGELWWFNNTELHGTYVHGNKDRISMIFDCKCDMERIINDPR
jgi:quercetin dioxygenase-like cupin family protein